MKTQTKYAVGITLAFCVYAFGLLFIAGHSLWAALSFSLLAFLLALLAGFWKRLIVPLLVISLMAMPIPSRAGHPKLPESKPKFILIACGVVVLVVGGYVVYRLWKLCDTVLPPPTSPPPAPPAPSTNSTPRMNAQIALRTLGTFQFHDFDISAVPACAPYTVLSYAAISSSTNLIDWRPECTITQWWTYNQSIVVVYTNGVPRSSSFSTSTPPTNYIDAVDATGDKRRFFKCE